MSRRVTAVVVTVALCVASLLAPASATAAPPPAGSYTAITAYRAANTATGAHGNRKGPLGPKSASRVSLSGHVPASASAALISLSAVAPSATTILTAYADGAARPGTWTLYAPAHVTSTVTAIVPLQAARFLLYDAGSGRTGFTVDVLGYYSGLGTQAGLLSSLRAKRLVSSSTTLAAGRTLTVNTGLALGTAALQVHALGAAKAGSLTVYRTGGSVPATSAFYYGAGGSSALTFARTSARGQVTIRNRGARAIHLAVDLVATFPGEFTPAAGGLQAVAPQRLVTGRSVSAGRATEVSVLGHDGIARTGVAQAVLGVVAYSVSRSGGVVVGARGRTSSATRTISVTTKQTTGALTIAPVSNGQIEIRNATSGTLKVTVDVLGYVPTTSLTPPASTTSAHYLDNLTADGDNAAVLHGEGCADAHAGATLSLLDVGAQSYHAPLSPKSPGVALALTDTVRLTYAQLVTAIEGYLSGYAGCAGAGQRVRVAVGTNNGGNYSSSSDKTNPPYPAATRGADWYTQVVVPLQKDAETLSTGITVLAADDIENDAIEFDGVYANAKSWVDAYLRAAPGSGAKLIFNGSPVGCPAYFGTSSGICNDGWTLAQLVALTSRGAQVQVLPQVYSGTLVAQWANLDAAAGGTLVFAGVLTENALDSTTFTAAQGWTGLVRGLSSVVTSPSVPLSVAFAG